MPLHFLIDFDGTISLQDTTDFLLQSFAGAAWLEIERRWEEGQINARTCLSEQMALVTASESDLRDRLRLVGIDPAFGEFMAACRAAGASAEIVSDGFSLNIDSILGEPWQHLPRRSNSLQRRADGSWAALFPHARADCEAGSGVCKCAALERDRFCVLIGDGRSDFCVAARADFVLAKGRLADHCAASRIAHQRICGFADATHWLLNAGDAASPGHYSRLKEDRADA